jgi:hypothetical protein
MATALSAESVEGLFNAACAQEARLEDVVRCPASVALLQSYAASQGVSPIVLYGALLPVVCGLLGPQSYVRVLDSNGHMEAGTARTLSAASATRYNAAGAR